MEATRCDRLGLEIWTRKLAKSMIDATGAAGPPQTPVKTKTLGLVGKVENDAEDALVDAMDIRVPTTTPRISEDRRQQILQAVKPGDIILETNNAYPGWQRMEWLTMHSSY